MNPEYVDIFRLRGHPYHAAMLAQPHARDAEFDALFAANPLRDGERILDIPAGGGYLGRHLGDRAQVQARELSHGFSEGIEVVSPDDLPGLRGFDRAVCLAALHHFDDAIGFLAQLRGTLAPGGLLHVADVAAGSPLCDFLDGFVGRYNVTGHRGRYLPTDPVHYAGLGQVTRCGETACPWRFDDEDAMLDFCAGLFGLVACPRADLRDALHDLVGVRSDGDARALDWRLLYIDIAIA